MVCSLQLVVFFVNLLADFVISITALLFVFFYWFYDKNVIYLKENPEITCFTIKF